MHAAVVTSFDSHPVYSEHPDPVPADGAIMVDLVASAIHPRVLSQADGSHYTATDSLPLVPGIDGVGRTTDGELLYFILPHTSLGAMADHTLVDPHRSIRLPEGVDPIVVAAAMNPAMSSWIALRRRIEFRPGMRVLVMGATGNAGRMAVQIAKRLGAGHVTAAGRNPQRLHELPELGADSIIDLGGDDPRLMAAMADAGERVDVVIDYLWGDWAATALRAVVPARADDAHRLTWIQVGSMAGLEAPIPSAALRACNLHIVGSGQGSVAPRDILAELPELATEVTSGRYDIPVRTFRLRDVTAAWKDAPTSRERLVIVP